MTGLDVHLSRRVHAGLTLDVTLSLGRECGVVFGPSGAGKTTLLRLIAGLERPDRGRVTLDGTPLFDAEARLNQPLRTRGVGMIFQDDLLFPHLSVASNLRYGLQGQARRAADERVAQVAALCGVDRLLDRRPATLSGGERQRVGLARALAPRPRLLLCDEPVSALDLASRHALIDRLRTIQRAESIPVLYVTHSPAEAIALGSCLFLLERGTIVAHGPPLDVLTGADGRWEGLRNVFPGVVASQPEDQGETQLQLDDGPTLVIPFIDRLPGARLIIEVRADDILLARGPIAGISARNVLTGTVERIVAHHADAEVIVRAGGLAWIASVVAPAVTALELTLGSPVSLIIKARSCHVID